MAQNEDQPKGPAKSTYIMASVAGVVIVIFGVVQLTDGNMPLGIAGLVVGAAAIAVGIFKPARKS